MPVYFMGNLHFKDKQESLHIFLLQQGLGCLPSSCCLQPSNWKEGSDSSALLLLFATLPTLAFTGKPLFLQLFLCMRIKIKRAENNSSKLLFILTRKLLMKRKKTIGGGFRQLYFLDYFFKYICGLYLL